MGSSHTKQNQLIKNSQLREPNTKATQKDDMIIITKKKTANRQRQVITVKRFIDPRNQTACWKWKNVIDVRQTLSLSLSHTHTHTHARTREGCRTTLVDECTVRHLEESNKWWNQRTMHRHWISKTEVNTKTNFFVSDGQRGRPVGALHCDGCWKYIFTRELLPKSFPTQKKKIYFLFFF